MIKHWLITGDLHGSIDERFNRVFGNYEPSETAIIILGDTGANYYLNKKDRKFKEELCSLGYTFYCVHGNHEERPENIDTMKDVYDDNVNGIVFYEEEFPNLRYFLMYGEYKIAGYGILVIGGAYSVDKEYRQLNGWQWFETEQLTEDEQDDVFEHTEGKRYDLVFSHTCPFSLMPIDLFLPFIDQSKVDNTMEHLFDKMLKTIEFKVWCYGHYHADRWQNPQARMFFKDVIDIHMLMGYCD